MVFAPSANGRAVLCLRGELDVATGPVLAQALGRVMARDHQVVVVDLAELEFIDWPGVRMLVDARARLRARSSDLTLRSPPPLVRRVLDVLGLNSLVQAPETPRGIDPAFSPR
ncbi:MAG: STAS domain-containing protein [Acidimicrobiia bacterium]